MGSEERDIRCMDTQGGGDRWLLGHTEEWRIS